METRELATRDDLWRIQETLGELAATQAAHSDRIMRLEQKTPDGSRSRSLWGAASPFAGGLGSSHHGKCGLGPAFHGHADLSRVESQPCSRSLSKF